MNLQLVRLLHLASPALPVGAFSYSQGLEWAVESGTVTSEAAAQAWIRDALHFALARCEAPALIGLLRAWRDVIASGPSGVNADQARTPPEKVAALHSSPASEAQGNALRIPPSAPLTGEETIQSGRNELPPLSRGGLGRGLDQPPKPAVGFMEICRLNAEFIATRETAELRAETLQMGYSLARLLRDLPDTPEHTKAALLNLSEIAFPTPWAAAAAHWQIEEADAANAYLWAWLENQVMAAVKLVPLGQTAGQRMLVALAEDLPALAQDAVRRADSEDWENFTPGMTLASCQHETQYTRLFRS